MRKTYSYHFGMLGALALGVLAFMYMGENIVMAVIAGIIGFVVAFFTVRKIEDALYKGAEIVERKIRSDAVSNEEDLLHTVLTFTTSVPLSTIRQAVGNTVDTQKNIWHGTTKAVIDDEQGVEWKIGNPGLGEGCIIQLNYTVAEEQVKAVYSLIQHVTGQNISPHIKKMLQLRNEVITAFKTADPNVRIEQSKQTLNKS